MQRAEWVNIGGAGASGAADAYERQIAQTDEKSEVMVNAGKRLGELNSMRARREKHEKKLQQAEKAMLRLASRSLHAS